MKSKLIYFAFLTMLIFFVSSNSNAECVAADDPCAPKIEKNTWIKSLAFGFNLTQGNSETLLGTVLGDLYKESEDDIWDFDLAYSYGTDDNRTGVDENGEELDSVTRNDFRTGVVYKNLLSERTYLGFDSRFLYDEIADIDYRASLTPMAGYFLVKNPDWSFDVNAGPGYILERVGGNSDDYFAPRIGQGLSWTISCTSKLYEKVDYTFDVNDSDNYLVNAEVGVEAALSSLLSLILAVRETYDNVPAEGLKKDDLAVISAIKVNL